MGAAPRRAGPLSDPASPILGVMHEITVTKEFAAAHAITIGGAREPVHGHNWRVAATVAGPRLDSDGLVVDFHLVERSLGEIVGAFHNGNLNEVAPFDRVNPTAELVASHIAERLSEAIAGRVPADVRITRVSVTEAPGCEATFVPEGSP